MIECYVKWLHEDRAATVSKIRDNIRQETAEYRSLTGQAEQVWLAGISLAHEMFTEAVSTGRGLGPDERRAMEAIGRDRADAGIPLEAVTASVNVAARVVRDWPTTRAAIDEASTGAFRVFSARATSFANAINGAIVSAYVRRTEEERATSQEQARARFWQTLLGGGYEADEAALQEGRRVGCELAQRWSLVLLSGTLDHEPLERDLKASVDEAIVVPVATGAVPHVVMAVPCRRADGWPRIESTVRKAAREHKTVLLAVGPCERPLELHRGYSRMLPLLSRLDKFVGRPGLVNARDLDEAALLSMLVNTQAVADFVQDTLGFLLFCRKTTRKSWLRTIDALVGHDGSVKAAASAASVHEDTVRRHMKVIEQASGIALDTFSGLARFRTAVILTKLSTGFDIFWS